MVNPPPHSSDRPTYGYDPYGGQQYHPSNPLYGNHVQTGHGSARAAGHPGGRPDRRSRAGRRTPRAVVLAGATALAVAGGGVGAAAAVAVGGHGQPAAAPAAAPAQPVRPASSTAAGSVETVAAKVMPSVVKLQLTNGQGGDEGSGVVLSPDGLILTNNHVVAPAAESTGPGTQPASFDGGGLTKTVTFSDGRTVPFSIVGTDPTGDLAVVQAEGVTGLTPITFGSSGDVRIGQQVVAIGSPLGLQGTVTTGIVSALDRPVTAGDGQAAAPVVLDALQTDAAINPGNSGGPLVDMNGDLVGINSAGASLGGGASSGSIGLGFAIPSDQAKRIADQLVSTGTATHGSLGVQLGATDGGDGAAVAAVVDGGPAAQGGLPRGALITKVDQQVIDGPEALAAAVRSRAPGDQVTLTYRDAAGTTQNTRVTLGSA